MTMVTLGVGFTVIEVVVTRSQERHFDHALIRAAHDEVADMAASGRLAISTRPGPGPQRRRPVAEARRDLRARRRGARGDRQLRDGGAGPGQPAAPRRHLLRHVGRGRTRPGGGRRHPQSARRTPAAGRAPHGPGRRRGVPAPGDGAGVHRRGGVDGGGRELDGPHVDPQSAAHRRGRAAGRRRRSRRRGSARWRRAATRRGWSRTSTR